MISPSKSSYNTMSTMEDVSVAIDNLSLLTISSIEALCPSKNCETPMAEQVPPPPSDINCNGTHQSSYSPITTTETRIRPNGQQHTITIPEDFNPTKDGELSRIFSSSVVPQEMQDALRDSINDKVKMDYVIRQNDNISNPHSVLRSNSTDCVITLYDSESDSDFAPPDSDDDSTDVDSELEYLGSYQIVHNLTSSSGEEFLGSDGESAESSEDSEEYSSDSEADSKDSDSDSNNSVDDSNNSDDDSKNSRDSDDEPCGYDEQPSGDESDEESATSDADKPDDTSTDEDSEEESSDHIDEDESSDHIDEDESSDDDKSIDLSDSSDSQSEASDSE